MKKLYTISIRTITPNKCHYRNANRFVRTIIVEGREALEAKIAEYKANNVTINRVWDYCGNNVEF